MSKKTVDITIDLIAFDCPPPPDYGGSVDLYFRIKTLSELGVKIILHYFSYNERTPSVELSKIIEKCYAYKLSYNPLLFFSVEPISVSIRKDKKLLERLCGNNNIIFFDSLQSCHYLGSSKLSGRTSVVRMHVVDSRYYRSLYFRERNYLKKFYLLQESYRLKWFQTGLKNADAILAISGPDREELAGQFDNVELVGPFHPWHLEAPPPGQGGYVLYHGNLAVAENLEALDWLLNDVLPGLEIPFHIAGSRASTELKARLKTLPGVTFFDSPSEESLTELIRNAQVHLLPSFMLAGLRLKLLRCLFQGRHCLVTGPMVEGTGLEKACTIAETVADFRQKLQDLFVLPYSGSHREGRRMLLDEYDPLTAGQKLVNILHSLDTKG